MQELSWWRHKEEILSLPEQPNDAAIPSCFLTEYANAHLLPHAAEYTSDATSRSIFLAPVLFKTIMRLAIIDNKTTR